MPIEYHPLSILYTATVYRDRADFLRAKGYQAPPFDASKPIRYWADEAPGELIRQYRAIDPATGAEMSFSLTGGDARFPNMPGAYQWPKFEPEPTEAYIQIPGTDKRIPVDPWGLISEMQAKQIAAELGTDPPAMWPSGLEVWGTETRRRWNVSFKGRVLDLARLRNNKYAYGVGAPGKWDLSGPEPTWETIPYRDPAPDHIVLPVPCRPLREGERLVRRTPFGMYEVATGEEDAPASAASIEQVYALLKQVARVLGVPPEV